MRLAKEVDRKIKPINEGSISKRKYRPYGTSISSSRAIITDRFIHIADCFRPAMP
jgi:hypothetical protein